LNKHSIPVKLYSDTIRVFLLSEISNDHRIPSQRHCSGFKRGLVVVWWDCIQGE